MRFRKRKPPEDKWTVATGTHDGAPIIVRVNAGAAPLAGSLGIQIGVAVPLNDPRPDGLPDPAEHAQLEAVEEELLARIGDRGVLVAVITTGTMREFVAYTATADWIEAFHHEFDAAVDSHEVQVMAKHDPDWSVYRSLRG